MNHYIVYHIPVSYIILYINNILIIIKKKMTPEGPQEGSPAILGRARQPVQLGWSGVGWGVSKGGDEIG